MERPAQAFCFTGRRPSLEVLLAHPGGPFWAKRDEGAWTIPKGELGTVEEPLACARREFFEETGVSPDGEAIDLGIVRRAGGKKAYGYAVQGDCDPDKIVSNTFEMEWPRGLERRAHFRKSTAPPGSHRASRAARSIPPRLGSLWGFSHFD